jgi:glucose-1-phosphate thymidylyltransferase
MIAVVLAGGYAKRLWPLTLDKPKALLPVAGKPLIDHVFEKILKIHPSVRKIIVSTNLRFQSQFEEWLETKGYDGVELIPDSSRSESDKIGAVKALSNIASAIGEEFIVLAGDNLFIDELNGFMQFFNEKHSPVVALYHARNLNEAKKSATVVLDDNNRIAEFIEKPENPKTTLVGACLYAFPARTGLSLKEYVARELPQDEPGKFIEWLHKVEPVYGFMLNGHVLDVGTLESYKEAEKFLQYETPAEMDTEVNRG